MERTASRWEKRLERFVGLGVLALLLGVPLAVAWFCRVRVRRLTAVRGLRLAADAGAMTAVLMAGACVVVLVTGWVRERDAWVLSPLFLGPLLAELLAAAGVLVLGVVIEIVDRVSPPPGPGCPRCGYDLRGQKPGGAGRVTCPECGWEGAAPEPAS